MSVHLHVRSCFTLLQSTMTIQKIIDCAKEHGYTSVALTDKNVMHGAMAFYHACKKEGIHPVFGMEVDVKWNDGIFGLLLLAKNDDGYQSLMKLSTRINTDEHIAILTLEELLPYTNDCVVITNGDQNNLETYIIREEKEPLIEYLKECSLSFSNFYVSIARNDSGLLASKNPFLKSICKEMDILTVALSRVYFKNEQEEESYKTLCAIAQGVSVDDKMLNYSPKRYFRSMQQMEALYEEDDLKRSDEIASMCQVKMQFAKAVLPKFQNKYDVTSEEFLRSLCQKGLMKRMDFKQIPTVYQKRLDYELDIIIRMQYADYFLIVWDFIRFAKTRDIYIGPGRGSAAGSLVSYCLGITHVDPIKYDLLFERFLNPERVSMPDIDTDFPDNRRDEVIQYVKERYGTHRVSHIITFNTLAAKQVLRDVGRSMNINIREIDTLCKMVPYMPKVTLDYTYHNVPRFKQMINSSDKYKQLFMVSKQLEGLPRHSSLHAAGIIMSNVSIEEVCPLIDVDEGMCASQFTMEYMEELGLIKMDFLGLRNLTIIDDVVRHIQKGAKKDFDIMRIPLDDKKTFQLIQAVDTMGVFQLESEGMKNLIRQMKPHCFEDIVATVALFRPGPMENIPEYLKRREHPETIDYIHPVLEPILKHTYGIMIYQEQIMQAAQTMAGFSLGKADNLRKAISKKKGSELVKLQQDFIDGAIQKGFEKQVAEHVYELIMKFANYGFGRAHSVAYGMIAYQMAYLKANAPLYFFMSLLNSVIGSETKTSEYVFEAKKRKLQILSPDINSSSGTYEIEGNALRYPLLGIKGIGSALCVQIIEERNEKGKFKDYFDFVARMCGYKINKKIMETLIFAGALDCFKINRASMIASLDDALRYGDLVKIEDADQVLFDFDLVSKPALISIKENSALRAEKEKEMIGFYLSKHPIEELRSKVNATLPSIISLHNKKGYVKFICILERIKQHRTKKGDLMAFLIVADETSKFDLVCMPNLYEIHAGELVKGNYFYVEGVIDEKRDNSCLIKKITRIETQEV
ncbi:DNA polymerase III subunit alpha [Amedibacillus sp. YH-ame6]